MKKKILITICIPLLILIFFGNKKINTCTDISPNLDKYIAHAGGAYQSLTYTNSLEALESNYAKGYRYFEIDLSGTADGQIVSIHDWQDTWKKYFNKTTKPTHTEFISSKMNNYLTQLDLNNLMSWFDKHQDAYLVTDIKNIPNIQSLQIIIEKYPNQKNQIIPQIYNIQEYLPTKQIGFENIFLTLYRTDAQDEELLQFVTNNNITAITMPENRAKTSLPKKLRKKNVPSFVHTINKKKTQKQLEKKCVYGFYTDTLI